MKIKLNELTYENEELKLSFEFKLPHSLEYEYAYYLYQDNKIVKRVWYQTSSVKYYQLKENIVFSGTYQIRLFIKYNKEIIFNELTNPISVNINKKSIIPTTFKSEKIFFNDIPIKYVLQESKIKSPYLIISFSGLYSTEFQGGSPVYNHIRTLESLKSNKLFILDSYENQFCYYVGFGGNKDYERSVISLITKIANKLDIPAKNIIATGSSKGGSAALYYSMKYYFGKAIIGAPQIYISKFLNQRANSDSMRQRYHHLLGENEHFGKKFWDNLILNQVNLVDRFPEMSFHIGEGDYHYKQHLQPLLSVFEQKKIKYELDIKPYNDHNQTGTYFTPFLYNKIQEILNTGDFKK